MNKAFAILLFVVLLATATFGYAVAQNKVDPRMIDMEKRKLQDELQRYKDSHTQERFDRLNINKSRQDGPSKEDRIQAAIDELDRDPELYFYKKQQQGAKGSPRVTTGIDPVTGKPVTVIVR